MASGWDSRAADKEIFDSALDTSSNKFKNHAVTAAAPNSGAISNVDVVVLAVYVLGGVNTPVDTEAAAVKANKLAPGRFTWRRYKSQISMEHIRVYLSDAKKQKNGRLLSGDGTKGWTLTSAGLRVALRTQHRMKGIPLARPRSNPVEDRRRRAEIGRIQQLPAWEKYRNGDSVSRREAEAVFRLSDYVRGARRDAIIDRIRLLFARSPEYEAFVNDMGRIVSTSSASE